MKFVDISKLAIGSLKTRKLRSWLTVIGIVIGTAAIVTLVSFAQGIKESVSSQLSILGGDMITVIPGFVRALQEFQAGGFNIPRVGNLTENDVRVIKDIPEVLYVDGIISGRATMTYQDQTADINLNGVDTSVWKLMITTELESGRLLAQGDNYVAVLGHRIAHNLFKNGITTNKKIVVNGKTFKVVGILKEAGLFGQIDSSIFVSKENAIAILNADRNRLALISVKTTGSTTEVGDQITKKLLLNHHVTEKNQDFTVITPESISSTIDSVTATLSAFFGGIAAISLIVGGIGVANTMFTSVVERTRQIGILKALGATSSDIRRIFVIESGLLGLLGGVIGIVVGFIAAFGISEIGLRTAFGSRIIAVVTPELLLFAGGFSLFVGMISGLFPANRAAKLEPVEALRYE